ncbi:MAG: ABC transporter permease [Candidatus Heimdallarchaeota archaeon]|nr:ABC transporter permease [Candidatus Heimdallarchaeota archaeon]MDH5644667.1 ABC transporter permease [Candidatus Heimdallarchaeota archaeon]
MATATKDTEKEQKIFSVSKSQWYFVRQRLKRNKVGMLSLNYIYFNVLLAIFYPILIASRIADNRPGLERGLGGGANAFPNLRYPAGTDSNGLDSFSRLLAGSETSILVALVATGLAYFIGISLALIAGYYRGRVEEIIMRLSDLFLAFPVLIFLIMMLQIARSPDAGNNPFATTPYIMLVAILIGFFGWPGLTRLVVAQVKQVGSLEFVHAVKIIGASDKRIIFLHIFPNVLSTIITFAALSLGGGIIAEAGLAFLGFSDPINTVSWGVQVQDGLARLAYNPEQVLIPGFTIFFLILAINLFGDALRDALDPRLKE